MHLKILMISLDFPPTVGGISAHVYELSKALLKLGNSVSIATKRVDKKQKRYEEIEGLKIYRFDLKYIGFIYGMQINSFAKELNKKENFDIIHIHGMRPLEFFDIKNTPLVYTNHTSGYLKRIKKGGYRVALMKKLFQKPDLFLAPSKELLETPFKIHAKKRYIPNGVEIDKYKKDIEKRAILRKKLNIKDNEIVGIVTRRMVWKNGVLYLAKATKYIKNKKAKLLFIGDGEDFAKIKEELSKNFEDRYILLGSKKHDEIIPYYSAADFSILPSIMEATSISGLEAMAASLPLVGTITGGIPDLIEDGKNGFLCKKEDEKDLADKIDILLGKDLKVMGKNSYEKVKNEFSWDIIAKKTLEAYKEIL